MNRGLGKIVRASLFLFIFYRAYNDRIVVVVKEAIMATEEALDRAGIKLPDEYRFASAGHWIDVINSSYDHDQIRLHFTTPADRTVEVDISLKDARELRKELKAAITLVSIAEDY